ncbi:hypothetical protein [Sphingomonas oligoaromativorans]|uniref:hypothetical protein n=1 Tax=Sphingomonas oligoaromativorans TaxID=575322 RepID=UPI00141DE0C8|nr:hypothetical protein [Sphingomonas oligoaromativorans]NIJ34181.1 hypothetical protein [Sphingomonas oligoaromativorans]
MRLRAEQEVFPWEREEDLPLDAPPSIWAARTGHFATGEGLTTYYYATYARSEAEFRRKLARRVDATLANSAQLSDYLRAWVEKRWRGGAVSLFVEHHVNYS